MSSGLCLALEGLSLKKKNPSWEEPLQKSQFLTENSLKMSHFRPTSRGEDLGEHLDVFRWQAIVEGVLQVSQVRRQMVGTCGKRFMWQAIVDLLESPRSISTRGILVKFIYRYSKSPRVQRAQSLILAPRASKQRTRELYVVRS